MYKVGLSGKETSRLYSCCPHIEKSHPNTVDNLQLHPVRPMQPGPYSWAAHLRTPKSRTPSVTPELAFNDDVVSGCKSSALQGGFSIILWIEDSLASASASSLYDSSPLSPRFPHIQVNVNSPLSLYFSIPGRNKPHL